MRILVYKKNIKNNLKRANFILLKYFRYKKQGWIWTFWKVDLILWLGEGFLIKINFFNTSKKLKTLSKNKKYFRKILNGPNLIKHFRSRNMVVGGWVLKVGI